MITSSIFIVNTSPVDVPAMEEGQAITSHAVDQVFPEYYSVSLTVTDISLMSELKGAFLSSSEKYSVLQDEKSMHLKGLSGTGSRQ